jgi:GntR family transcriptional repressor for pyruvate dehydrogenase complex
VEPTADPDDGHAYEGDAFRPSKVQRPREQVEAQLKRAILSGAFKRGARLPSEARLAQQFSVSRPTIRDALRGLAEIGLISRQPGARGGSFVEYLDHHALGKMLSDQLTNTLHMGGLTHNEVTELRNMLEVPSARLAAQNRTEVHLKDLRDVIDREKSMSITDPATRESNARFHVIIADASGNRLLSTLVTALHRIAHPMEYVAWSPEIGKQGVIHHIAVARAIRERDSAAAAEAMQAHLQYLAEHSL